MLVDLCILWYQAFYVTQSIAWTQAGVAGCCDEAVAEARGAILKLPGR